MGILISKSPLVLEQALRRYVKLHDFHCGEFFLLARNILFTLILRSRARFPAGIYAFRHLQFQLRSVLSAEFADAFDVLRLIVDVDPVVDRVNDTFLVLLNCFGVGIDVIITFALREQLEGGLN